MKFTTIFCTFVLLILIWSSGFAQEKSIPVKGGKMVVLQDTVIFTSKDTLIFLSDTTLYRIRKNPYAKSDVFYDSIKNKSYRSWFSKNLYDAMIMEAPDVNDQTIKVIRSEDYFKPYEGKVIGKIRFKQIEVFGANVQDTTFASNGNIEAFGNKLHNKTKEQYLRKFLLFDLNETLSPLELADNERILRNLPFIKDSKIYVKSIQGTEEVEVIVVVQDVFPWAVGGSFSALDNFRLDLTNKNVMRRGKEITASFLYKKEYPPPVGVGIAYRVNNIGKTLVDGELSYINSTEKTQTNAFIDKPFLTPSTKWGFGLNLGRANSFHQWVEYELDTFYRAPFEADYADLWLGRSVQLKRFNSRENLYLTGRFVDKQFHHRPDGIREDTLFFFQNDVQYLTELSYSKRNYMKSSLIYGYGITEDIPIGSLYAISLGYQNSEFNSRPYFGGRIARGLYKEGFGFNLFNIAIGGYIEDNVFKDGVLKMSLLHISDLHYFGRYKVRNIISGNYTRGIFIETNEKVRIDRQVRGISGENLEGKQVMSLKLESIVFTPWYFLGFKFAPYGFTDVALLGDTDTVFDFSNVYLALGAGVRIRNESLVFQTIQLRFAYYPIVPVNGSNFGFEFSTSDPQIFRDFRPGKPTFVTLE